MSDDTISMDGKMSVDYEGLITVELIRTALAVVSWNMHDSAKFPDDEPTVKKNWQTFFQP